MKIMQIGSSLINMANFTSLEAAATESFSLLNTLTAKKSISFRTKPILS